MFPTPETASQPRASPSRPDGVPSANATGPTATRPTSMTHARVAGEPIRRLARDAVNVVIVQDNAAPRPPRTAHISALYHRAGERLAVGATGARPLPRRRLDGPRQQRGLLDVSGGGADRGARRSGRVHPRPRRDRFPRRAPRRRGDRGADALLTDRDEERRARARDPRRRARG